MTKKSIITNDPWSELKVHTDARISLGRCGASLPLRESLDFKLAHARARDAVHQPFEITELAEQLRASGHACLELESDVADRGEYLTRPDKGRKLSPRSRALLQDRPTDYDVCLVVGDGLSSRAIHENAFQFIKKITKQFAQTKLSLAPICLVKNSRVAIADEIGSLLRVKLSIILIGERPGLSSPNSMGAYVTYKPAPGTTDEARNCISNIRQGGLPVEQGVQKLAYLVEMAFQLQLTGIKLKDNMPDNYLSFGSGLGGELPE